MEQIQAVGTLSRLPSLSSTYSIFESFEGHVNYLIDASLSNYTKVAYDKALNVFKDFRLQFNLPLSWPPSVDDVINFLGFQHLEFLLIPQLRPICLL